MADPAERRAAPAPVDRRRLARTLGVGVLGPLVVLVVVQAAQASTPGSSYGDWPLMELATSSALRFDQFLGPYSQYGFNHPGPALFYWYAPFYAVSGRALGGLALGAAALNLISMGLLLLIMRKRCRSSGEVIAAMLILSAFIAQFGIERLREPWNPVMVILPVAVVGIASAALAAGERWCFPVVVLAASVAMQTHIGTVPVIAAMGVTGLVVARLSGGRLFLRDRWSAVAAGAAAILWALPVGQQLFGTRGNLGAILDYFLHREGPSPSSGTIFRVVGNQLALSTSDIGRHIGPDLTPMPDLGLWRSALLLGLTATLISGLVIWRRQERPFEFSLCAIALTSSIAAVVAGMQVTPPANAYLMTYASGVGIVVWSATAFTLVEFARQLARRYQERGAAHPFAIAYRSVGGVAIAIILGLTITNVQGALAAKPFASLRPHRASDQLSSEILRRLSPEDACIGLNAGDDIFSWEWAASTSAVLDRQGIAVHVPDRLLLYYGRNRYLDGCETKHFVIDVPGGAQTPPGQRPIRSVVADDTGQQLLLYEVDQPIRPKS